MSTDRGQRRTGSRNDKNVASKPVPNGVQLAPGTRLVLVCPGGEVQLNKGAATILLLCDGSRTRDDLVAEAIRLSRGSILASDIREFLEVARTSGWIIGG